MIRSFFFVPVLHTDFHREVLTLKLSKLLLCHNFGWEAIFKVQCKISGLGGKYDPKLVGEKMGSKLLLRLIPRSTTYCASPGGYGFHKRRQERYNTR